MFDKEYARNQKFNNKERIDRLTVGLLNYYSDPNKKGRLAKGLCRCCAYVDTSRIGGAAITMRRCDNCGEEMSFANTCTDMLCQKCAVELKHCAHCGQKLN